MRNEDPVGSALDPLKEDGGSHPPKSLSSHKQVYWVFPPHFHFHIHSDSSTLIDHSKIKQRMDDPLLDAVDEFMSSPLRASDLDSPEGTPSPHAEWKGMSSSSTSHRFAHSKSPQKMKKTDKEFDFLAKIWDRKKTNVLRPYV